MTEILGPLAHLLVVDRVSDSAFTRGGGGDPKIRDIEQRAHGRRIHLEAESALADQTQRRSSLDLVELESLGVIVTIEGVKGYPLKLHSLEERTRHRKTPARPKWLLLNVQPETDLSPERAQVWISDDHREAFLKRLVEFRDETTKAGNPRHRALVANIGRVRTAVLQDLWQSSGDPPAQGLHWWEIWLQPDEDAVELAEAFARDFGMVFADRVVKLDRRHVVWLRAPWSELAALPFSAVPVAEIRRPTFVDSITDIEEGEQHEYVLDLAGRVTPAGDDAPAVCLLDTGVRRTHVLLQDSLLSSDVYSVVGGFTGDSKGHGTLMAGLALLGPLDDLFADTKPVRLIHRLESVKLLPDAPTPGHKPEAYGVVMAEAVATPEVGRPSTRRVYAMPVTAPADRPGEPSLWSATVDALAGGSDVGRREGVIELLGTPSNDAKRLIFVSAGNVDLPYKENYTEHCDLSAIEDPAQAWNAVVVGATTSMVATPSDPTFDGWTPVAAEGDVSPHSRTGVIAGGEQWPIRPDICMEGGNVLTDGEGDFHADHPLLSVSTTSAHDDRGVRTANATSAATAQAARLAAKAMAFYPSYWPETVRGLLTHHAEWTPLMRQALEAESGKKKRRQLLKRYGWGVPDEDAVLHSNRNAVTMVVQDEFVPFTGTDHKMRNFRLHELPWPQADLAALGGADVELRLTLSYFIEPSASRRGWRSRYAYQSHGLRFEMRGPNETTAEFVQRVNHAARRDEDGQRAPSNANDGWFVGPDQRNKGSLHQDVWRGFGSELANTGVVSINAVGGWWKNNRRKDRQDLPVRYALVVSLRTPAQGVDLYTPIATSIGIPSSVIVDV